MTVLPNWTEMIDGGGTFGFGVVMIGLSVKLGVTAVGGFSDGAGLDVVEEGLMGVGR